MMPRGVRSNSLAHRLHDRRFGHRRRPERIDHHRHRLGDADRVRELHFAPPRELGGDDVLRDPARRIARRAIDLRRILAAERAAAVPAHAAVRVDDDLAAGEPGIALRTADDEAPRRVDVILRSSSLRSSAGIDRLDHLAR